MDGSPIVGDNHEYITLNCRFLVNVRWISIKLLYTSALLLILWLQRTNLICKKVLQILNVNFTLVVILQSIFFFMISTNKNMYFYIFPFLINNTLVLHLNQRSIYFLMFCITIGEE